VNRNLSNGPLKSRRERARTERMIVKSAEPEQPWTDYAVSNTISGKTYRVAVRRGANRATPIARVLTSARTRSGPASISLHVLAKLKRRFTETELKRPYHRRTIGVHMPVPRSATLRLLLPRKTPIRRPARYLESYVTGTSRTCQTCSNGFSIWKRRGRTINIYPDAGRIHPTAAAAGPHCAPSRPRSGRQPESHPLRRELLKAELLPYQLDRHRVRCRRPAAPCLPMTWGLAKPSKPSESRSCSCARLGYRRCSSSVPRFGEIAVEERNPALL